MVNVDIVLLFNEKRYVSITSLCVNKPVYAVPIPCERHQAASSTLQGMPACARSLCSGSKWVVSEEPRIIRHT